MVCVDCTTFGLCSYYNSKIQIKSIFTSFVVMLCASPLRHPPLTEVPDGATEGRVDNKIEHLLQCSTLGVKSEKEQRQSFAESSGVVVCFERLLEKGKEREKGGRRKNYMSYDSPCFRLGVIHLPTPANHQLVYIALVARRVIRIKFKFEFK